MTPALLPYVEISIGGLIYWVGHQLYYNAVERKGIPKTRTQIGMFSAVYCIIISNCFEFARQVLGANGFRISLRWFVWSAIFTYVYYKKLKEQNLITDKRIKRSEYKNYKAASTVPDEGNSLDEVNASEVEDPQTVVSEKTMSEQTQNHEVVKEDFILEKTASEEAKPAFCKHCGKPLTPEGKFCRYCGKPVAGQITQIKETPEVVKQEAADAPHSTPQAQTQPGQTKLEVLREYKQLLDEGLITEADYEAKKKQVLEI